MALDASSNGNFNTRNSEEAVKVIENLASSNNTKNTDFERKRSATILGNDQMDEVKAKLYSVHKLLKKQVSFVEDAEAVEGRTEEEEVNYIGGVGFQGNRSGNRNSYGNRSKFNQNSQYQKPYNNSYNNNRNFGSSYYQKPPPLTQESKIEEMLDRVNDSRLQWEERLCLHQPEHKVRDFELSCEEDGDTGCAHRRCY